MAQHHVEYITGEEPAVRTRGIAAKSRKWLQLADQSIGFFFLLPVPASSNPSRSINEQVDVRLWLQPHLLSDEETGLRRVLLRSFLQPHFRAAAAAGRRLPSSAKGNAAMVPSVPSVKRVLCDYSRSPRVMCCAGSIWPHAKPSFIYNLYSTTVLFTSNHTLSLCVR